MILSIMSMSICQNLNIEVTILQSGWFTLDSWTSIEELWYVDIQNTSSLELQYKLKFELRGDADDLKAMGITKTQTLGAGVSKSIYNKDPVFNSELLEFWDGDEFQSQIEEVGYLPPGNYTLTVSILDQNNIMIDKDTESMIFTLGDQFSIQEPDDGDIINSSNN